VLDLTIRPRARRDLREIWRYSRTTWSRDQANRYLATLNAAIQTLRSQPGLGRPCDDISPELQRRSVERHVIFFRIKDDAIIIARVLHGSMSAVDHLANDDT